MPSEPFGALVDVKTPPADFRTGRGDIGRLAIRCIEFFEAPPLVAAITAALSNGSKANPAQTLHQGGGRNRGEGLGDSHFFVLC